MLGLLIDVVDLNISTDEVVHRDLSSLIEEAVAVHQEGLQTQLLSVLQWTRDECLHGQVCLNEEVHHHSAANDHIHFILPYILLPLWIMISCLIS